MIKEENTPSCVTASLHANLEYRTKSRNYKESTQSIQVQLTDLSSCVTLALS